MADYYVYIPCPGSTGTQFYSNVAPTYPGAYIRFDSGSDLLQYGKCFHVMLVSLEVPPTPLVSINWSTVVYSFWNNKCSSCVEQAVYYQLVNCLDTTDTICVLNDLTAEYNAGWVLTLPADPTKCWYIEWPINCISPVNIIYTQYYPDCITCGLKDVVNYELINCLHPEEIIYTSIDLSLYVGLILSLIEYPDDCWEVNAINTQIPTDLTITVNNSFVTCTECTQQYYLLEDCSSSNPELNIITNTDLSAYVGTSLTGVIVLNSCPGVCWIVSETDITTNSQVVNITGEFTSCETCMASMPCICSTVKNNSIGALQYEYVDCNGMTQSIIVNSEVTSPKICLVKWLYPDNTSTYKYYGNCVDQVCPVVTFPTRTVRPGYNTPGCSPEKYEQIMCNFSEGVYRDIMVQAYGITPCCGEDDHRWTIRKELIELKAIQDPNYICLALGCGCTTSTQGLTPCIPPPVTCVLYSINIQSGTKNFLHYLDCAGVSQIENVDAAKQPVEYIICGIAGQTNSDIYCDGSTVVFNFTETTTLC